ncbi:MAG: addiction module protein [bacterium]|nr:addiction module protein [bacterium]
MPSAREIIREAASLPVEERALVVDSLLRTLNPPDAGTDNAWLDTAKRRLAELRAGRVQAVPGDQVFAGIEKKFAE